LSDSSLVSEMNAIGHLLCILIKFSVAQDHSWAFAHYFVSRKCILVIDYVRDKNKNKNKTDFRDSGSSESESFC
jgi:hypothetical protein